MAYVGAQIDHLRRTIARWTLGVLAEGSRLKPA